MSVGLDSEWSGCYDDDDRDDNDDGGSTGERLLIWCYTIRDFFFFSEGFCLCFWSYMGCEVDWVSRFSLSEPSGLIGCGGRCWVGVLWR